MSLSDELHAASQFDYLAVGHVTVDVVADGATRVGGTAFYSALQAARLGRRAAIVTRGRADEIAAALGPYRSEVALYVEPAPHTTTLATSGLGDSRSQRMLAWAGPISDGLLAGLAAAAQDGSASTILHLAPVAGELDGAWLAADPPYPGFVGLTPQGLLRRWRERAGEVTLAGPGEEPVVARRCEAIVLSDVERSSCTTMIDAATRSGTRVAVTAGTRPTRLIHDGEEVELPPSEITQPVDDLGAGDVFAAAFFVSLSRGEAPLRAAELASAAAAVRVRGVGAQALGDAGAIEARLHEVRAALTDGG
jgi:sugar/nucleoside kinase (ribokinase family)